VSSDVAALSYNPNINNCAACALPAAAVERYRLPFADRAALADALLALVRWPPGADRAAMHDLLAGRAFCPSGNTLTAAARGAATVRPNCCVLPQVTDANREHTLERARRLWAARVGCGFELGGLADPVAFLHDAAAAYCALPDARGRGNMAVLRADHPRAAEFVRCKTAGAAERLFMFNISVAVPAELAARLDAEPGEWAAHPVLAAAAASAAACGCPGVLFLDRVAAPAALEAAFGPVHTTVPCGEQAMHANETCNLGVLNLAAPALAAAGGGLDLERVAAAAALGTRYLDAVVDVLDTAGDADLLATSRTLRRIGLGVTGFADVLRRRGLAYDSPDAVALGAAVAERYAAAAHAESERLAAAAGECWPGVGRRNVTVTCLQPAGNITALVGAAGYSIEPLFGEATRLAADAHLRMQGVWQRHLHNAISKTVNLAAGSGGADVLAVFRLARAEGCKSVTVYVDGSRAGQPMSLAAGASDAAPVN